MTSISIINCGKASARQLASAGFEHVLDLVEVGAAGLLEHIKRELQ